MEDSDPSAEAELDTSVAAANSNAMVDSPLFNYHSVDDEVSQFSVDADDSSLPPASLDARLSRRSVMSVMELDGLQEADFPDQGKTPDKPAGDVERIMTQIKSIVLFEGYDEDELKLVTDYMYLQPVTQGEIVIRFGSVGDAIYVVKRGKYKCTVPTDSGVDIPVRAYNDEGYFGELALINHAPRAATITAVTDGELWVLNAMRSAWLRKCRAMFNADRFEQVIQAIPLLRDNLNPTLISRLIDALDVVVLAPGEIICRQGDPGDAMYFVMNGEVEAIIDQKPVRLMIKNEFFGERALVLDEGRAATCRAKTMVKLAKLPKENFSLIMPDSVVDRMRQHIAVTYGLPAGKKP